MDYKVTKSSYEAPKVYLEWVEEYQVEAIRSESWEVFYLSMDYDLQEAGFKLIDTRRVMYVNYGGQRKLKSLYKLMKME